MDSNRDYTFPGSTPSNINNKVINKEDSSKTKSVLQICTYPGLNRIVAHRAMVKHNRTSLPRHNFTSHVVLVKPLGS
ncbi:hypothetical protein KIN20_023587 [Parelaphostrongylus tenuis]|uniref:Uncharacterized protein n=1 Tax=Parelaphostrongylus tenuis TaxID=148309 RepID=A0AAD5QT14_PARTN|nr:hypothetical protein KIN20_023587 [Parelaphostrongylus tenuis]